MKINYKTIQFKKIIVPLLRINHLLILDITD
jgi:hypothetical protein